MTAVTERLVGAAFALGLCLVVSPAHAAKSNWKAQSLAEAQAAFQRTDAKLNTTYRALQAKLRPQARATLAQSQRAWIKFRDLECAYQLSVFAGKYDTDKELRMWCMSSLTYDRDQQLEGQLSCPGVEGQVDCPRP